MTAGFDDELARLEAALDMVPYPDRALLLAEVAGDLESAYQARLAVGLSEPAARAAALLELDLDPQALADAHQPAVQRALARLPPPARDWVEQFAVALPLAAVLLVLTVEVPLVLFLREGGAIIFLVLGIGLLGLLLEFQRFFLWFVLRDHSHDSLRKNTPSPLYLAAGALAAGLLGTASNYYAVLYRWSEGALVEAELRVGLREPITCVIVGAALATLIVLFHGALQAGLRALGVPGAKEK